MEAKLPSVSTSAKTCRRRFDRLEAKLVPYPEFIEKVDVEFLNWLDDMMFFKKEVHVLLEYIFRTIRMLDPKSKSP